MRRVAVAILVVAALTVGGCTRSESEQAGLGLAVRALGSGVSPTDLEYRREVEGGFVWRLAPRPAGSAGDNPRPTHVGVIACVDGDRATEAVRFSYLHWQPQGCQGGRAQLRRVRRTAEQDVRELGTFISPPRRMEDDPALERLTPRAG